MNAQITKGKGPSFTEQLAARAGTTAKKTPKEIESETISKARAAALVELNTNVHRYDGRKLTFPYQVAPGKKLQTKLGELVQGARVTAELVGGQAALDALVEKRLVLKAAKYAA